MKSERTACISQCIRHAKEKISQQQERIDLATSRGLCAHEERGILFIMVDTLETMMKRRAQLLKASANPFDDYPPHQDFSGSSGHP